ncbi:MAG: M3 family metallopeptidase [Bacteroidales bacterium]|nr:M3 family metallopeptidase [Bacteroidales bacterium]
MKKHTAFTLILLLTVITMNAQKMEKPANNPLVETWNTPFQTPPFEEIKTEHYLPAFGYALAVAEDELYHIKTVKTKPTFENTIVALERSGKLLGDISGIFFNLLEANTSSEMQKIAQEISPALTDFSNRMHLDPALFGRVEAVYKNPGDLTPEQKMLLEKTYKSFVRAGANLSDADKEKYREYSMRLSTLSLQFGENALNALNAYTKLVTDKSQLSGIPESALAVAREKAKAKGQDGWLFDLSMPSYLAVATHADNRELRKELYMHYSSRAFGGEFDNQAVIKEILTLRDAIAKLLGYNTYADYVLEERMAENAKNVYDLENKLLKHALPVAKREMRDLQSFAATLGFNEPIQRWDFAYYSEKYKTSLFNVNDEMLKPYFKLENVIKGVFGLATDLFGLTFVPNDKIQVYHPDVKVYEVYRGKQFMAVLYLDFHPRDSKRAGAWMTEFRGQSYDKNGKDIRPLVSLVMNFTPSTADAPSLLTFNEVRTFMHEFGHSLHGMLSDVHYESLSGTSVPRDFVELPSQLLENWSVESEYLNKFAFHYQTGEPIPAELIQKINDFDNFHAAYACVRQVSFGLLDMMWHTTAPDKIKDVAACERNAIKKTELMPEVEGTCMSTAFSHIFSGGYAAGYYGYKWAEVLEADAFSLFKEKGVYNKDVADSYVENILSKGGTEKAMDLYVKFRGRKPKIDALLKRSGLVK